MSRSLRLELCPNNSQEVLGSLDSIETPDIRNWFSSYVYESPELDTLDGFQNFDVGSKTLIEGGVKTKLGENENAPRRRDGLVAGVEGSVDGIVECDGPDGVEHNQPAAMVSGLSSPSQFSEHPHIKNWFSSYVYESPPLDTVDDMLMFGYKEREDDTDVEKGSGKNVKTITDVEKIPLPKRSNISPVNLTDGDKQNNQSVCKVSGLSESPSQFSEPPHIKNWFSSYVYESPPLDTIEDLATFICKEKQDNMVVTNAQKACRGTAKDMKNITDVEQDSLLPKGSNTPSVVLKCTNLVEDAKQECLSACKDGHSVDLEPSSSKLSQWPSGRVSGQTSREQMTANKNHSSIEKSGSTNSDRREIKLCCSSTDKHHHNLLNTEKDTRMLDGKVICVSTGNGLGKEDIQANESLGASGSIPVEGNPRRSQTARGNWKENQEAGLQENGFISTRKNNRHINSGDHRTESSAVQFQVLRNRVKPVPDNERQRVSRKALSETTNFHSPHTPEVTGKWHCPQKRKPDLCPPLKQLRLEKWIRRV